MSKLGIIKCGLETLCTWLLLLLFPFPMNIRFRFLIVWVLMQFIAGRYRHKALLVWDELKFLLVSYIYGYIASLMMFSYGHGFPWHDVFYLTLFYAIDFIVVVILNRYAHLWFWKHVKHNVLIVGTGPEARQLYSVCRRNRFSLMDPLGFVDCSSDPSLHVVQETEEKLPRKVYPWQKLEKAVADHDIDTILIAIPDLGKSDMKRIFGKAYDLVPNVNFMPRIDGEINFASQINDFDGSLLIATSRTRDPYFQLAAKRIADIIAAIPGMVILVPLTVYVWISNRRQGDKDPIFFVQERIGRDGRLFKMYKYRTMVPGAEAILEEMMERDAAIREEYEVNKKLKDDPRITKAGKFLREKSLDEFPQFFNVLKGDMSLVGPRPYLPREKEDMGDQYDDVIAMKPGITGMWQTHGRSDVDFDQRLELDAFYYRNWNLWLDFFLLIRTAKSMLSKGDQGAY